MTPYNSINHGSASNPHPQYNNVMIYNGPQYYVDQKIYSKLIDINLIKNAKGLTKNVRNGLQRFQIILDIFDSRTDNNQLFGTIFLDFKHRTSNAPEINNSYEVKYNLFNSTSNNEPTGGIPFHPDCRVYYGDTGFTDPSGNKIYNVKVFVSGNAYGALSVIPKYLITVVPDDFNKATMYDYPLALTNANIKDKYDYLFTDFVKDNTFYSLADIGNQTNGYTLVSQYSKDFSNIKIMGLKSGLSSDNFTINVKNGEVTINAINIRNIISASSIATLPAVYAPNENLLFIAMFTITPNSGSNIQLPGQIYITKTGEVTLQKPIYDFNQASAVSVSFLQHYSYY